MSLIIHDDGPGSPEATTGEATMSDIVDLLRETAEAMASRASVDMVLWNRHSNACLDASDEITRLRARVAELEEGLGLLPFNWLEGGVCVDPRCDGLIVRMTIEGMTYEHEITVGDLRRARALAKGGE